ncbi:MAG TPA: dihydrofolate reductase [Candidatus Paceibacterota bacterium]|nr:dihydrofolate reductase [Candidatus Paceibacterota bacterium]
MFKTDLSLVAAMSRECVIGANGTMPWRLPSDLKRFKTLTTEIGTVIMGRKTHESILAGLKKPLPGRRSIVLTRARSAPELPGVVFVNSVKTALAIAGDRACVIGGGEIYDAFSDEVSTMYITRIEDAGQLAGDTIFPMRIWAKDWERVEYSQGKRRHFRDEYKTTYEIWRRKR